MHTLILLLLYIFVTFSIYVAFIYDFFIIIFIRFEQCLCIVLVLPPSPAMHGMERARVSFFCKWELNLIEIWMEYCLHCSHFICLNAVQSSAKMLSAVHILKIRNLPICLKNINYDCHFKCLVKLPEIALSKNDQDIEIYKKTPSGYEQTATLSEHGQRVTGIDWEPQHNRIVTSGAVSLSIFLNFMLESFHERSWI